MTDEALPHDHDTFFCDRCFTYHAGLSADCDGDWDDDGRWDDDPNPYHGTMNEE